MSRVSFSIDYQMMPDGVLDSRVLLAYRSVVSTISEVSDVSYWAAFRLSQGMETEQ